MNCPSKGSLGHVRLAFALEDDSNKRVGLDRRHVLGCGHAQAAWRAIFKEGMNMKLPALARQSFSRNIDWHAGRL